ncbi:MAG TPA: Maf family protein [Candidatus Saccharimonadales bacterium]|nr:Maf family protein [Candidatus Saccharimonadales bacterium]
MILASASPRRSELLRQLELKFDVLPGHAEEVTPEHLSPAETAQVNAYRKARLVAKKHPDRLVLGADTVVSLGHLLFGKPSDLQAAEDMLAKLQGRTHLVITGVCLIHLRTHRQRTFFASTAVTFRTLHAAQIRRYLSRINPLDKAGAYAIQEEGDEIVKGIKGSFTNVVGLPLEKLEQELERWSGVAA